MRFGVLVSGRGSNLEAVLRAGIPGLEPVVVVSNRPAIPALEIAAAHSVPSVVLRRADHDGDAGARDAAIGAILERHGVELALLAGYDQLLRAPFFATFTGRTINIHPSLLPAHGGPGMIGTAVHRSVIAAGEPWTGVTIHEVTPDVDAGPILGQSRVPVDPADTADELGARVLDEEHRLLVATLARIARGAV